MASAATTARPGRGALLSLMAVIAVLGVGAFLLWSQDLRRQSSAPEYSVHRTDDRGLAVLFRLYEQAGLRPRVWDRDLTKLQAPGILLLVAPAQSRKLGRTDVEVGREGDLLPHEIRALDEWVKRGNTAVILAREPNDLYQGIGLIVDEPRGLSGTAAEPAQPGILAQGVSKLRTTTEFGFKYGRKKSGLAEKIGVEEAPPPIEAVPAGEWVELFTKRKGPREAPQVVSAARGKGLYVAVNDPYPASNLGVTADDNARFMLNLAGLAPPGGTVWFDEYHKRNVDRGIISYLRDRALAPALIYLLLLLLLVFWRAGVPFGTPEPLVADRRRDSTEYVAAVAALYRNAWMGREALRTLYGDFRRRLSGRGGAPETAEVSERYERRTGRPAEEAGAVVAGIEAALADPELGEEAAMEHARRLARLDEALRRGPAARRPRTPEPPDGETKSMAPVTRTAGERETG